MNICYLDAGSLHSILYVVRPEITDEIYEKFVAEFKAVPGSEYERLVHRIAKLILFCGEDLSRLYHNFYGVEYEDFADYLEAELGLDEKLIKRIQEKIKDGESLWRIDISDFETYNFMNIFDGKTWDEEPIVERINMAIMRCENEN